MSILLVQSCSKSKNRPGRAVPALELYSGYFFKIIKKAIREGEIDDRFEISILSAKYGLISDDTEIEWYDRRMDTDRAESIANDVKADLCSMTANGVTDVVINAGGAYVQALADIEETVTADVHRVSGAGIGHKGAQLKQLLRAPDEHLSTTATVGSQT